MQKIKVVDLFGVQYDKMGDKINDVLEELQGENRKIIDFKVLGDSLNKCAVFILYEE